MDEKDKLKIGYSDGQYIMVDTHGSVVAVLAAGMVFEVWMGGEWQAVSLHCGGYRGYYYETSGGERGRLALCMQVQICEASAVQQGEVLSPLERVRLTWVGKQVQSRVPVAGGYVSGEVREVTERGMVVFVYRSRLNGVPVKAIFAAERIDEVLVLAD